jgi:hypothetical protein
MKYIILERKSWLHVQEEKLNQVEKEKARDTAKAKAQ